MPTNLFSPTHSLASITLGLLVHPYQTVQTLIESPRWSWLVLTPTAVIMLATVTWKTLLGPVLQATGWFYCANHYHGWCLLRLFLSNWLTWFVIYWQVLLLYLFARFWVTLRR